jgi:hypothetical protein
MLHSVLVAKVYLTGGIASMPDNRVAPATRRGSFVPWVSVLGLVGLSFVLGAAVMEFNLPLSGYLRDAFVGARVLYDQSFVSDSNNRDTLAVTVDSVDKPDKTFDGFTLYAYTSSNSTQAFLVNMRREVVHQWEVEFSKVWPKPTHLQASIHNSKVAFLGCYLYPNGELLATFYGDENPANGYGLAKLDKNSKVLWAYSRNVHHDVDVAADGTIYALKHELVAEKQQGLEGIPSPLLLDYLVVLSSDGKEIMEPISILQAFRDSPFSLLVQSAKSKSHASRAPAATADGDDKPAPPGDIFHANSVKVLSPKLARQFPLFKPGQVLLSLREIDAIAVLDVEKRAIVWAACGPWQGQHDAQFLDNGHLLVYDNLGMGDHSRVLEYDPPSQSFPWSYEGENREPFLSKQRGLCQRLPNGNTLVVNSKDKEILEVTAGKQVVWTCRCNGYINFARRYDPHELRFLPEGERARP